MNKTASTKLAWTSLTFVSGNENKRREYAELLSIPNLRKMNPEFIEPQTLLLKDLVEAKIRRVQSFLTPPFFVEHTGLSISG